MKRKTQSLYYSFTGAVCAGAILFLGATTSAQAQYIYTPLSVPGASSTEAYGISGNNIVDYYGNMSSDYGFLATPVPEPSALGFLAVGIAILTLRRTNQRARFLALTSAQTPPGGCSPAQR